MTVADYVDQVDDFDHLSVREQVKLISYFHIVVNGKIHFYINDIRKEFIELRLPMPSNLARDIASLCLPKPPVLIKTVNEYTFHRSAKKALDEIYLGTKHKRAISVTLRDLLTEIKGKEQQAFLEEAISCFEIKAYRASVVMTWLLTLDVIYEYIITKQLTEFNAQIQGHGKYKKITFTHKDDFSDMKESDFIEIARGAGVFTGDIRKILVDVLNFRNTCAHPNTIVVAETKAIAVIEDLVNNVVKKFQ